MDDQMWKTLYREFSQIVRPMLSGGRERRIRKCDMLLWVTYGLAYSTDGDQSRFAMYGLTESGETVSGWEQLKAAAEAHRAEMERRREMIREF